MALNASVALHIEAFGGGAQAANAVVFVIPNNSGSIATVTPKSDFEFPSVAQRIGAFVLTTCALAEYEVIFFPGRTVSHTSFKEISGFILGDCSVEDGAG